MRVGGLGFVVLASAALLPAQDKARIADIDEAFRLADVRTIVESLPSHVRELTAEAMARVPKDQRQILDPLTKEVTREVRDPDGLYRDLRAYFVKHYDGGNMAAFLALERTPTYRTMHRLEAAVETPAAEAGRRRFEANLKEDPPEAKRLDLLRRLDNSTNATGMQLSIVLAIVKAMSDVLGAQTPPGLDTKVPDFTPKMQRVLADKVLAQYLYVYRNADDADLEDYAAAAEQPAVAWFNRNLQSALLAVVVERETHLTEDLKKANQKGK